MMANALAERPMTSTILIVEDDPGSRQALQAILSTGGYVVEAAENGKIGLQKAAALLPDLVLLDVMMPEMDGYEVCRRLRADPRLAEVPVVMVTALDDHDSRLRGLEAGADDFLSKPYDSGELRARVRTITRLNRYRSLLDERQRLQIALDELSRKNRELETLSRRIVEVQERERRTVAVELHDEIGQNLTALKILTAQCANPSSPEVPEKLRQARKIIEDLITRVRNMSLNLRPSMLDDFGLYPALTWLADKVGEDAGLNISTNFTEFNDQRFPADVETAIFRIAQEALTNTARHAHAQNVRIELTAPNSAPLFMIQDDGVGFDPEHAGRNGHYSTGLSGMHERARMAGGYLEVEAAVGHGCTVTAKFRPPEVRFL
jgi:signal transduction histidine kinase